MTPHCESNQVQIQVGDTTAGHRQPHSSGSRPIPNRISTVIKHAFKVLFHCLSSSSRNTCPFFPFLTIKSVSSSQAHTCHQLGDIFDASPAQWQPIASIFYGTCQADVSVVRTSQADAKCLGNGDLNLVSSAFSVPAPRTTPHTGLRILKDTQRMLSDVSWAFLLP